MAHHKSAIKKIRQDKNRTILNKSYRTRVRNAIKRVRKAINSSDVEEAKLAYKDMVPILDRMASRKILHRNTASRMKSRLNKGIRNLVIAAK